MKAINSKLINPIKSEILYGIHPVTLALEANRRQLMKLLVKKCLVENPRPAITNILKLANKRSVIVSLLNENVLDKLSHNGHHQGICMEVGKLKYCTQNLAENLDIVPNKIQLFVALESIYDPMNFGSIIRTCSFLGIDQIIISEKNCCHPSPIVSKASSGAMEIFPIKSVTNILQFLKDYKEKNWNVIGTSHLNSGTSLHKFTTNRNSIILFGNEGNGLSNEVIPLCDDIISINKPSQISSTAQVDCLNVNVAAGIVMHHIKSSLTKNI